MAGYSGTPLIRKLGIKPGGRVATIGEPANYRALLGRLPEGVTILGSRARALDFLHLFVTRASDLRRRLPRARTRIVPDGMIWVSWPKRTSGVVSDLTEDVVRGAALANILVDVKVCAVDEIWSALKLVIPIKERGRP